jgi:hypothetical protein
VLGVAYLRYLTFWNRFADRYSDYRSISDITSGKANGEIVFYSGQESTYVVHDWIQQLSAVSSLVGAFVPVAINI